MHSRVGDFWAWAYSDILTNTSRGTFAEFLVGKALGVVEKVRPTGWEDFDLSYGGWKIEVKASAYVQSSSAGPYGRERSTGYIGPSGTASTRDASPSVIALDRMRAA